MQLRAELFVADLAASARFYEDVLGFARDRADDGYVSMRRGDTVLGLGPIDKLPATADDGGFDQRRVVEGRGAGIELVLEIHGGPDAVDALHRHSVAAGARIVAGPVDRPWGLRDFRLLDPDGYYLRVTHTAIEPSLAKTPDPPYTAVVFSSIRTPVESGYAETAAQMEELAARQPGYLGIESARSALGITVSYWSTHAAAKAWKQVAEHRLAQQRGREWYRAYRVRIATVEREYGT